MSEKILRNIPRKKTIRRKINLDKITKEKPIDEITEDKEVIKSIEKVFKIYEELKNGKNYETGRKILYGKEKYEKILSSIIDSLNYYLHYNYDLICTEKNLQEIKKINESIEELNEKK